jgi:hypothetical protein
MTDTQNNSSNQDQESSRLAEFAAYVSQQLEQFGARDSEAFRQWSVYRLHLLSDFNIQGDVDKLSNRGIAIQTIALAMMAINIAPGFDYFLKQHFGDRKTRRTKTETIEAVIPVIREFAKLQEGFMEQKTPEEFFKTWKIPHPDSVVKALEYYIFLLNGGELLFEVLEANSLTEIAKFALAAAVNSATGRFYDREVSALTGAALQKSDYDETAHRVWRIRNFDRLAKTPARFAAVLLKTVNDVVTRPA